MQTVKSLFFILLLIPSAGHSALGSCASTYGESESPRSAIDSLARLTHHFNDGKKGLHEDPEKLLSAFSRQPVKTLDPSYVSNMVDVMIQFDGWLKGDVVIGLDKKPSDVAESTWKSVPETARVFSYLHRLATLGMSSESYYWPGNVVNNFEIQAQAGQFRNWSGQVERDLARPHEHRQSAEEKIILETQTADQPILTQAQVGIKRSYKVPQIAGIPDSSLPRYLSSKMDHVTYYQYPKASDVPLYLAQMDLALVEIKAKLKQEPVSPDILKPLARYYQLGIIGHPFFRVNNSLLMSQVNTVLIRAGMTPVSHGELDYLVRVLSSGPAETLFIKHVKDAQAQPAHAEY